MEFNRRRLLKKSGAGIGTSVGLSGMASADGTTEEPDAEELSYSETWRRFRSSLSTDSVRAALRFVRRERIGRVDYTELEGYEISLPERDGSHTLLEVPLFNRTGSVGQMSIRFFDEVASVNLDTDDTVYKSNPEIIREFDRNVLTASQWRRESDTVETQIRRGVDSCSTQDIGDLCLYLGAATGLAGATLVIIPEGGSTAVGIGILAKILGSSATGCAISEVLDRHAVDGCNYNSADVCVDWNCRLDPISGYWCDPEVRIRPNYTNC